MAYLNLLAIGLAVTGVLLSAAIAVVCMKFDGVTQVRLASLEQWMKAMKSPQTSDAQQRGDLPAFARMTHNPDGPSGHAFPGHPLARMTHNPDGPSGHAFHGHAPEVRHPGKDRK